MFSKRFSSITHLHIYAIINTIITFREKNAKNKTIRLLDVGCGTGDLLSTLIKELTQKHPGLKFEFYGLDVDDSHVQEKDFFNKTISTLLATDPFTNWQNNIRLIRSDSLWPFADDFFDIIYSNQVMEHVFNQAFLLSEIKRTMLEDGYSFHVYPLKHYIYEGHLLIPFVHKFKSWTTTYFWIKWASRLGIGKYKIHKREGLCLSVDHFSERHADYMAFQVNYQTTLEITNTAKKCRLKPSFDFSYLYYKQKLRSLFKLDPIEIYKNKDFQSSKNNFYFLFFKYVSSITLMLRKKDNY